jgi:5-methylcytosine-specific restriction endonuclease McrA
VFARDGHRCVACGSSENLTVDHILARALGGSDALWNLQTLCGPCNTAKAVDEGRLSMERARPATIACSIERCPWCRDHPSD